MLTHARTEGDVALRVWFVPRRRDYRLDDGQHEDEEGRCFRPFRHFEATHCLLYVRAPSLIPHFQSEHDTPSSGSPIAALLTSLWCGASHATFASLVIEPT